MNIVPEIDWTGDLELAVKTWAAEGKSRGWIAAELRKQGLNCSRNAVIGKLWRLGVRSPLTKSQEQTGVGGHKTKRGQHKSIMANIQRGRAPLRKLPNFKPSQVPQPVPLYIPTSELSNSRENYHCRALVEGTSDRCEPLYCGHRAHYGEYCDYHRSRFYQVGR